MRQELQRNLDSENTVDACFCTIVDVLDEDVEGGGPGIIFCVPTPRSRGEGAGVGSYRAGLSSFLLVFGIPVCLSSFGFVSLRGILSWGCLKRTPFGVPLS